MIVVIMAVSTRGMAPVIHASKAMASFNLVGRVYIIHKCIWECWAVTNHGQSQLRGQCHWLSVLPGAT